VRLQQGDLLLFMTDGFPEMANADDELIGYPRVSDIVETSGSCSPDELLATLDEAADDWLGGRALQDDFTFVAVRLR
jgi:serine phosphatase RsbU (regulator of sigma subunit)